MRCTLGLSIHVALPKYIHKKQADLTILKVDTNITASEKHTELHAGYIEHDYVLCDEPFK